MSADAQYPIAGYIPVLAPSIISAVIFMLLLTIFWMRITYHPGNWMTWLFFGTGTITAGFIVRAVAHPYPYSIAIYIIQAIYILLAPSLFLAQAYVILPRLVTHLHGERYLAIKPKYVLHTFLTCDLVTYTLQAAGGGLSARPGREGETGSKLVLAGLVGQCVSYACFMVVAVSFAYRYSYRRATDDESVSLEAEAVPKDVFNDWRMHFAALMWASTGFMIRGIYRVVEYAGGTTGYVILHEIFFYLLDVLPLFLAISAWAIFWPPQLIAGNAKTVKQERRPSV